MDKGVDFEDDAPPPPLRGRGAGTAKSNSVVCFVGGFAATAPINSDGGSSIIFSSSRAPNRSGPISLEIWGMAKRHGAVMSGAMHDRSTLSQEVQTRGRIGVIIATGIRNSPVHVNPSVKLLEKNRGVTPQHPLHDVDASGMVCEVRRHVVHLPVEYDPRVILETVLPYLRPRYGSERRPFPLG